MTDVRVRIAPSPTGTLHIGTARTALFNYLFAKKMGGQFLLRVEDTDKERSTKEFEKDIVDGLALLDIHPDNSSPVRQSERSALFRAQLEKLLAEKKAFYCGHPREELEAESKAQRAKKESPRHICSDRDSSLETGIIRFRNDERGIVIVHDLIRGDVEYRAELLGDFSIARAVESPLYNFAAVVDDHDMGITHVIRGEDHLSNTPKQILIGRALGFEEPLWAHLPLLLNPDHSKLSKREGALGVKDLIYEKGYLPEALCNFIVLLGWHPRDEVGEILNFKTMVEEFSLERVQKAGAVVSFEKLAWLNKEYIKTMSAEKLWMATKNILSPLAIKKIEQKHSHDKLFEIINALKTRVATLRELETGIGEIFTLPDYNRDLLLWKDKIAAPKARETIDELIRILSGIPTAKFDQKSVEEAVEPLIQKDGKGAVLWPLRAALSGREASIGPFELVSILGQKEAVGRLKKARESLDQ